MADAGCQNTSQLSTLPYKHLQAIAMSLHLPANLKQSQLVTIIEARYSQDEAVIERILRATREMRNRGRALRLRSSSSASTSPTQESPSGSPPESTFVAPVLQLSLPTPSSSPEDLTCPDAKKKLMNYQSPPITQSAAEPSANEQPVVPAQSSDEFNEKFLAEESTQIQDGLLNQNSLDSLTDPLEESPSCATDSVTNSVSSDLDALVDAQDHCLTDLQEKESVGFTELKPVPASELIDLSTPLIEASLDFTRHGLENEPSHDHDVLLYPPTTTLAQGLISYSEMDTEDIIVPDQLVSLTMADSTGQITTRGPKRQNEDDEHSVAKSRRTDVTNGIESSMALVTTDMSTPPTSFIMSTQDSVDVLPAVKPVEASVSDVSTDPVSTAPSSQEMVQSSNETVLVSSTSFRENSGKEGSMSTFYLSSGPASPSLCGNDEITHSTLNGDLTKNMTYSLSAPPSLFSNQMVTVTNEGSAVSTDYPSSAPVSPSLADNNQVSKSSSTELAMTKDPAYLSSSPVSSSLIVNKKDGQSGNRITRKSNAASTPVSIMQQLLKQDTSKSPFSRGAILSSTSGVQPQVYSPGVNVTVKGIMKIPPRKSIKRGTTAPANRRRNLTGKKVSRLAKLQQDLGYLYPERLHAHLNPKTSTQSQPLMSEKADSTETCSVANVSTNNSRLKQSVPDPCLSQFNVPSLCSSTAKRPEQHHILFNDVNEKRVEPPKKNQYNQQFSNQHQNSIPLAASSPRCPSNVGRVNTGSITGPECNISSSHGSPILPPFNRLYKELNDVQKSVNHPRMPEMPPKAHNLNSGSLLDQSLCTTVPPPPYPHVPAANTGLQSQSFSKEYGLQMHNLTPTPEPVQTDYVHSQYPPSGSGQNSFSEAPWPEPFLRGNGIGNNETRRAGVNNFQNEFQNGNHLFLRPQLTNVDQYGEFQNGGHFGRQTQHIMQGYPATTPRKTKPNYVESKPWIAKDGWISACLPKKLEFLLNHRIDTQTVAFPAVPKHVPTFRIGRMDYVFVTSGVVPLTNSVDSCNAPICSVGIKSPRRISCRL